MKAEIKALDTLFFRDGKPFSRAEETWADGIFPPFPSVPYGALRSWYIAGHKVPFSGTAIDESASFEIKQIAYRLPTGNYLPMPLDLAADKGKPDEQRRKEKDKKAYRVEHLQAKPFAGTASNYPCPMLLLPPDGMVVEEVETGLLHIDQLKEYLNTPANHYSISLLSDYAIEEPKVGIGRNDYSNAAEDAQLFRVGMRRASDFELLLDFNWPMEGEVEQPDASFFVKLGGECKVAEIRSSRQRFSLNPDDVKLSGNRFKIYLSTPAIFDSGWQPDLSKFQIVAKLMAAAIGRPQHMGGFDIAKGKPKPMYKAIPAGSVFYYETDENLDEVKAKLFGKAISDLMPEQGFGIAYIGNWQPA